ncbi:MAG: peptidase S10 [Rhodanobacteraceae bacterium]|nr:MAG: peptidase S10 [Rhodanobacteraceae bacterium]
MLVAIVAGALTLAAPAWASDHAPSKDHATHAQATTAPIPKQRSVVTHGSVLIEGKTIRYTATAGTLLLYDKHQQPVATVFYVAYDKDGVRDPAKRPLTFLYNGGPGASSDWIQIGGLGPYHIAWTPGAAMAPSPYPLVPNHESLLNDSDLVFIDAVGTGYSHVVGKGKGKMFWGVDQDVRAFAQFIRRYLNQYNRWNSPKFLYGESYGTTRSAALAEYLQDHGIELNGVVLQSSVLNYFDETPGSDNSYTFTLPTFAAIAWYHHKLANPPAKLPTLLQQARTFADGPFAQALRQGDKLPQATLDAVAQQMSQLTGLPADYIERAKLRVTPAEFRKELLLPEREHIGRYDGRYVAGDVNAIASTPAFDPSNQDISPAVTTAFHWYLQNILKWNSDRLYRDYANEPYKKWDWKHKAPNGRTLQLPDVALDLAVALRKNPYLRVLSENGYFDMATPFHATEYDLSHMLLGPKLDQHVELAYFYSGHPIYVNPKALKAMHARLDAFYASTLSADAGDATH